MRTWICHLTERIARAHHASKFKLAAVVASGSRILAVGVNYERPHVTGQPTSIHAENSALRQLSSETKGDIYVCRILANGGLALAKPCPLCQQRIFKAGISSVFYSDSNGWQSEGRYTC
jgi:cytidine deaminase